MSQLQDLIESACLFFRTKSELVDDVRFLRAENADLRSLAVKAQRSEADAVALMAQAEQRAVHGCNDWTVHLRLAHEVEQLQAQLAEALGSDPHEASA